jgi:hypothetical protein
MWSVQRCYNQYSWSKESVEFCMEAEKRWHYNSVDGWDVGYLPDSNNISTEAEESPLLRAVTK